MQTSFSDMPHGSPVDSCGLNSAKNQSGWRARLHLRYTAAKGKTTLAEQCHSGPLMVQKPFYPEGPETCHTYLIHPPGGVVAGDKLGLNAKVEPGAHAVITTPAAGKFYRSIGDCATQTNSLQVSAGAALEWLPQETIVYNQAHAKMHTIVHLSEGARFIGWEMVCLGLPASGRPFEHGRLVQRFEIFQDGRPLCIEPFAVRGDDPVLTAPWGLAGQPVMGTLMATTGKEDLRQAVRSKVEKMDGGSQITVTRINGLTLCRYLGGDVYQGLKFFLSVWEVLRPAMIGRAVCVPRIWAT